MHFNPLCTGSNLAILSIVLLFHAASYCLGTILNLQIYFRGLTKLREKKKREGRAERRRKFGEVDSTLISVVGPEPEICSI